MDRNDTAIEAAITRVLEKPPAVAVPLDFAARVRAALPAQPKARTGFMAGRSVSTTAAIIAAGGLVVTLCLLAPHARASIDSVAFDIEMVVLVELAAVAAWLGRASSRG